MYRLSRDEIARAWSTASTGGEKSVANHDEDSMTMAVESAIDCLGNLDRHIVDSLLFASTTSPYKEKQCAALISTAADLDEEVYTADYANSLRAGTAALRAAYDAVKAETAQNVLVTAADCRLGYPRSAHEQNFGDGAAALLMGNSGVIASVEGMYSIMNEMHDTWRTDKEGLVHSWEDRWVIDHGYMENMQKAISGIMKKYNLTPQDFSKAVLYAPDARSHRRLAQKLGFDIKTQVQDPLIATVGNTGAAHSLLMLVAALEDAKPGDRILLASYGDGADAFILRVTDEIKKHTSGRGVKKHLASKKTLPTYARYLLYRQFVEPTPEIFNIDSAATVLWRTRSWALRGHGSKCKHCGMITFPIDRICYGCQTKDEFEEVRLTDKKGIIYSYTLDNLCGGPETPVPQVTFDVEGGNARVYLMMTDCEPEKVHIDMPVEWTFRRLRESRGYYNYYWKCRPIRGGN
jgi:3-hydroxy-3-methylglutaryl CoA synthase